MWEEIFVNYFITSKHDQSDASHDLAHFARVAKTAKIIADLEITPVDIAVIEAAAYFHDIISLPKNHPDSKMSSKYSAEKARNVLESLNFPRDKITSVCHAIEAHSYSGNINPETIEAKIVQDADRMESLGALGAMRTFYVGGRLGLESYHPTDLLAKNRVLNDKAYSLDHFYCKLFKLPSLLQTVGGRLMAIQRAKFLQLFVDELEKDLNKSESNNTLLIIKACNQAGEHSIKLFDQADPFANKRKLEPQAIALDWVLERSKGNRAFVHQFIEQLKGEIS